MNPVPCPWCKVEPTKVGFETTEGDCVGYVYCENAACPVKPRCDHDITVNDDRGGAYLERAIELWNGCAAVISPVGGNELNEGEAAEALRQALEIIESVGTTGIYDKERAAAAWLERYFPAYR